MSVFKRINDILTANLNEMVDRWEDPEKMLSQAIREMEASIEDNERSVARAMASEKMVNRELEQNRREVQRWTQRAESAVEHGDDELARRALRRKQEYQKLVESLEDQQATAAETTRTLRRQLEGMRTKLAEAKRKLGTLNARRRAAEVRSRAATSTEFSELEDEAFTKFDRLQEKVERAEAEAEALRELRGEPARAEHAAPAEPAAARGSTEHESAEDTQAAVEAELAEMKRGRAK